MTEKQTKAEAPDDRVVRIWDDPESRISFLETVLKGKEWEAVIYHPDFSEAQSANPHIHPLSELSNSLAERGYKVELGQDKNGIPTLAVRHFGSDTSISNAVKEMGFAKGMTYKLTHIKEPLGDALSKTAKLVKSVATDKARLIGGVYMLGDVVLTFAGLGNKDGGHGHGGGLAALKDPANLLQTVAGGLATVQSIIYTAFAKEGSEAVFDDLMKTAQQAQKDGKDLLSEGTWSEKAGEKSHNPLGFVGNFLKRNPIQLGALTQVAGQFALIGSGGLRFKNAGASHDPRAASAARKGAVQDILTGINSGVGWALLMKHPKKTDQSEKLPWSNPKRVWQEMSENPNKFASGFMTVSTLTGMNAARHKGNKIQLLGNSTYLLGDAIMFTTQSDHYGAEGMSNAGMLASAAERFILASPLVLGKEEQGKFVEQLAEHVAERSLAEVAKKGKNKEVDVQEVKELGRRIADGLNAKLPQVNPKANEVAGKIAAIVREFPQEAGDSLAERLSAVVAESPSVSIPVSELKAHVLRQVEYAKDATAKPVTLEKLKEPLSALTFAVPGGTDPELVTKTYDALRPYMQPASLEQVGDAITAQAAQDVQSALQQQMRQPVAAQPSIAQAGGFAPALQAARENGQPSSLIR